MSINSKANKKNGTTVSRRMEIADLNATEARASIQTRTQGRFSQEAMEVLTAEQDLRGSVEADVLYQRLGEQWYAFTSCADEVYYSPVSAQQVAAARQDEVARIFSERDAFATLGGHSPENDIDALFHQPETQTGRKTKNGGGNA